jgi:5-methylcytosine-specific restriction endonuclease McrA
MSVSLRSLSDVDILSRVRSLVSRERELTLSVLLHLNEIERRKLHLKQGYASMFDYCTSALGYSASAAARRIRTARCVARFPEVFDLLKANEVNVSTVSQVSRILNARNKSALLARIRGKSQREVEAIVAEYQPVAVLRDTVRPIVVPVPAPVQEACTPPSGTGLSTPNAAAARDLEACEKSAYCRSGSAPEARDEADSPDTGPASPAAAGGAMVTEKRLLVQFTASEAFMAKLEKVRSLAWHQLPANASLEQVLDLALDVYLEHKDPSARTERREERKRAMACPKTQGTALPDARASRRTDSIRSARQIPAAVRDQVFARDKGRCTYIGSNGRRCGSTRALQVDHIEPVARGGAGTAANLRLLCAYHNRLEAERLMGRSGVRAGP